MYTHILLPTDGTPSSVEAIHSCMQLAKSLNAKVTGLHVIPTFHFFSSQTGIFTETKEQFAMDRMKYAERYLAAIAFAAEEMGVSCETSHETGDHPYEEIIRVAEQKGCDLIAMASHGRKGVKSLWISSETQKVLTHSKIPVLVYR